MRAVIFDLDGTLVDSLRDLSDAVNHVLGELRLPPHDLDAYRRFIGDGASMLVRRALGEHAQELHAEALDRFRARYFG
ncbi:MAG: HAD hydrolase-like protein, partial [Sandaracinaceae bacterium]|nr:HAD hydrolase-like protein [Sandaracinaceae bacterium]